MEAVLLNGDAAAQGCVIGGPDQLVWWRSRNHDHDAGRSMTHDATGEVKHANKTGWWKSIERRGQSETNALAVDNGKEARDGIIAHLAMEHFLLYLTMQGGPNPTNPWQLLLHFRSVWGI